MGASLQGILPTNASMNTKQKVVDALVEVLALAGAVEPFESRDFKAGFYKRMQETPFRDAYLKVRELMARPMDPYDVDSILLQGRTCEKTCGGAGKYEFVASTAEQESEKAWRSRNAMMSCKV